MHIYAQLLNPFEKMLITLRIIYKPISYIEL